MIGAKKVIIQSKFLKYEFIIKRNITIIRGESATGKTTMIDMLNAFNDRGEESGVSVICDCDCRILNGKDWARELATISKSIVFIDEGNKFITGIDFAKAIKDTDNYYVLVTRESIETLPYSVDEIYGIKSSGKYGKLEKVYHEFYKIYDLGDESNKLPINPEKIIVEDSNSGYEFFKNLDSSTKVVSANGKSNIFGMLSDYTNTEEVLIIADGAAFGSQIAKIEKKIRYHSNITLYLPESFEWIILNAGLINDKELSLILANPEEYVDSLIYFSWEQFFTHTLIDKTKDTVMEYSKKNINEYYLTGQAKTKIIKKYQDFRG